MMYFRKLAAFSFASLFFQIAGATLGWADDGFSFGKAATHISDVQFRHSLSPDNKAITIIFDNLIVAVSKLSSPIASRSLSVSYPMSGGTSADKLLVRIDGALAKDAGTSATLIVRVLGETHTIDLSDVSIPGDFTKDFLVSAQDASDLRLTLFLLVERSDTKDGGEAALTIDSFEAAIPLPPEKNSPEDAGVTK